MTTNQFQFALVFRADTAAGKAGLTDLAGSFRAVSAAGDQVSKTARKQTADLQALAAETARVTNAQAALATARRQFLSSQSLEAQALGMTAPVANLNPLQAAFRTSATAAGKFRETVEGLTTSVRDQAHDFVATAAAGASYRAALDDIRASFNPLFAVSRAYEQQLERIAEAEKLGAISAREAAAARAAAAGMLSPVAGPGGSRTTGNAGAFYASNIGAQGFDIGVTAAMGMNPLMIGLQQGSQLAGIAQAMGGGATAARGLAAGLMSIVNPTSLVTIGLVSLGAAGIQWLASLQKKAMTLEEAMGELSATMSEYREVAREAASSTSTLAQRFGADAAAARDLYREMEKLKRAQALDNASNAFGAATDGMGLILGGAASGYGADLKTLSRTFGLDLGDQLARETAGAVREAMTVFDSARFEIDPVKRLDRMKAAMGPLLDQSIAAIDFDGKRTDDEEALLQVLLEQNLALLEQKALMDGTAQADAARKQIDQMVLGYRQEAELAAAILASGEDSLVVERVRAGQARDLLEIKLEELGVDKDSEDAARAREALSQQQLARERALLDAKRMSALEQVASIEALRREVDLIGASNAERLRANALAEAEIEIQKKKLPWLEAVLLRLRAITRAGEEARRDQQKALFDIQNGEVLDRFDARIAAERNPQVRIALQTEREYQRVLAETNDAVLANAAAQRQRARSLDELAQAQTDYVRDQEDGLRQMRLELALIGQTETVRRRVLALAEAEQEIRLRGLEGSATAADIRQRAVEQAELTRQIEAQADAWNAVLSAGEGAVDAVLDKLRGGDVKGALRAFIGEIEKGFFDLAIRNPLKNALFGSNLGTWEDVGGWGGVWDRLGGKARVDEADLIKKSLPPLHSMAVTASQVTLGGPGVQSFLSGLNTGVANLTGQSGGGGLAGSAAGQNQGWEFFAAKGLRPHQIAAIMGKISAESGFDPLAVGDGGTSFGLFQHHAGRGKGLLNYVGGQQNLGNVQGQLEFMWRELMTSESGPYRRLLAADNLYDATHAFVGFERPQGYSSSNASSAHGWDRRLAAAEAAMAKFEGQVYQTVPAVTQLGTGAQTAGTIMQGMGSRLGGLLQGIGAQHGPVGSFVGELLGGWLSGIGFERGGWTGAGDPSDVAGLVHAEEYVFDAAATRRIGVRNLEALRQGSLRGYQTGGYVVGRAPAVSQFSNQSAQTTAGAANPALAARAEPAVFKIDVTGTGNREIRDAVQQAIGTAFDIYRRSGLSADVREIVNDRWGA